MFFLPILPLVKSLSDSNTTQGKKAGCMTNVSSPSMASFPFLSKKPEAFLKETFFLRASAKEQRFY